MSFVLSALRRVNVGLFVLFLVTGGVLFFAVERSAISQGEKRKLAQMPAFSWRALTTREYFRAIDDFVADNFAFRYALTELSGEIRARRGWADDDVQVFTTDTRRTRPLGAPAPDAPAPTPDAPPSVPPAAASPVPDTPPPDPLAAAAPVPDTPPPAAPDDVAAGSDKPAPAPPPTATSEPDKPRMVPAVATSEPDKPLTPSVVVTPEPDRPQAPPAVATSAPDKPPAVAPVVPDKPAAVEPVVVTLESDTPIGPPLVVDLEADKPVEPPVMVATVPDKPVAATPVAAASVPDKPAAAPPDGESPGPERFVIAPPAEPTLALASELPDRAAVARLPAPASEVPVKAATARRWGLGSEVPTKAAASRSTKGTPRPAKPVAAAPPAPAKPPTPASAKPAAAPAPTPPPPPAAADVALNPPSDPYQVIAAIIVYRGRALQLMGGTPAMAAPVIQTVNRYQRELGPGVTVYFMAAPIGSDFYLPEKVTHGVMKEKMLIDGIHAQLNPAVRAVHAYDRLAEHKREYLYFNTDHHWTGLGAYYAYTAFAQAARFKPLPLSALSKGEIGGFLGTLYYRTMSPALKAKGDKVEYYRIPNHTSVSVYQSGSRAGMPGMLYVEFARGANAYGVFLGGDFPLMKVTSDVKNGRRIVVIKDSYGNAFVPYLAAHYEEVFVIDYRSYKGNIKNLIREHGIQDVLFAHNTFVVASSFTARQAAFFLDSPYP
ncbi:MAG: DHHW family protein [Reyranellaceae bacterium]